MIRLITPPGILLTVALLAIYATYAGWTAYVDESGIYAAVTVVAAAACVGVALLKPWSQYPIYALTAGFTLEWLRSVANATRAGYFDFAFGTRLEMAQSLAPELALVIVSIACSCMGFRFFRRSAERAATDPDQIT